MFKPYAYDNNYQFIKVFDFIKLFQSKDESISS